MSANPLFFSSQSLLRSWFEKNHKKKSELWLGFYKVGSGKPSVTWPESVDEAICFGWIDGIRKSLGEDSYVIRFTPRKPKSIWSVVNINKVSTLTKSGMMKPEGLAAFAKREDKRSAIYAFEQKTIELGSVFEKKFKANKKAWALFGKQAPWYRKTAIWWVISAKQELTRLKRLEELIRDSEQGLMLKQHRRPSK
jgi:uncharacterized protein YdeI (YjbR/CyaY-like superfamily)